MKWMKLAGIIGIIFFVYSALTFVLSFTSVNLVQIISSAGTALIIIFSLLTLVGSIFLIHGFAKMGKYAESKLLKVSSWSLIMALAAVLILGAFGFLWISSVLAGAGAGLDLNSLMPILGGLVLLLIPVALIGLFIVVMGILSDVGLIQAGKKVRFAKAAGILGLVTTGIGIIAGIYFISLARSNPMFVLSISPYTNAISSAVGLVSLLLLTLALFDASKKFEKN